MERTRTIFNHLTGANSQIEAQTVASASPLTDTDDDVVIVSALRTPICKSRRGQFKVGGNTGFMKILYSFV